MTIENAYRAYTVLNNISSKTMPAKTAYKVSKLCSALKGEPIINGNGCSIQKDKVDDCANAIKELREIEATVVDIKINLSELENIELSPNDIAAIYDFIEED